MVVIDPKGDLITDLCDRLPDGAESRTVLIDPEDPDAAPVLNVLAGPDPDLAVDNLVGIFRSIFAAFWGPRTDDVLRSACLTLLRYAASSGTSTSLADVPRLLADNAFRAPSVAAVADDTVGLGGFWNSYEAMTEANRAQVIGPVMNKLRAFLLRDFVRSVVGRPGLQLRHGPGPRRRHLPGPGAQGHPGRGHRPPARFASSWPRCGRPPPTAPGSDKPPGSTLARGRRVPELLAPAPQLRRDAGRGPRLPALHGARPSAPRPAPRELAEAVSSNARTKVWFSMSPEDAHASRRHVAPEVSEHDLSHLGAYTAAARLVVDGEETPAFTLRTRPAPPAIPGRAEAVRDANRAAHSRPARPSAPARPALLGRTPCAARPSAMSARGSTRAPQGPPSWMEPLPRHDPPHPSGEGGSAALADLKGRRS